MWTSLMNDVCSIPPRSQVVLVSDKVDLTLFAWDLSARTALPGKWESEKWRFRFGNRYNTLRLHAFWVWKPLWVLAWNRKRSFSFCPWVYLPSGKHCIKKQAFQYSNHACYALNDSTKYLLSLGTGQGRGAEQKINVRGVGARTISTALVLVGHGLKSDLRDIN